MNDDDDDDDDDDVSGDRVTWSAGNRARTVCLRTTRGNEKKKTRTNGLTRGYKYDGSSLMSEGKRVSSGSRGGEVQSSCRRVEGGYLYVNTAHRTGCDNISRYDIVGGPNCVAIAALWSCRLQLLGE
jgi:hypothetical protein